MKKAIAIVTALTIFAHAPVSFAEPSGSREYRSEPGKHKFLGMMAGLVAGTLFGGYAAARIVENDHGDESIETFLALWTAFAVGGAAAGYGLAGGFSDRVDLAMERDRQAVRNAQMGAAAETNEPVAQIEQVDASAPLPQLRLTAIDGFYETDGVAMAPEVRIASLR